MHFNVLTCVACMHDMPYTVAGNFGECLSQCISLQRILGKFKFGFVIYVQVYIVPGICPQ